MGKRHTRRAARSARTQKLQRSLNQKERAEQKKRRRGAKRAAERVTPRDLELHWQHMDHLTRRRYIDDAVNAQRGEIRAGQRFYVNDVEARERAQANAYADMLRESA